MCKKLILLVSIVLVLDMVLISGASAVDADLIGWWPLNDGSGDTVIDLSASGNDGTINNTGGGLGTNGSVWVDDPERGIVVSFNGDNSSGAYISTDLIIPFMDLDNDFTWALWVKQEGDGTGVNETMLGNRYGGTPTPGSGQFIKFTSTRFEYYSGDHNGTIDYDDPPPGEWVHMAVVKDGATLTHYRNGELSATSTTTATIDPNPFGMGGDATNATEMWSGHLSDVRLYTKALSEGEILGVMEGGTGLWPYASKPDPKDGSLYSATWLSMSWRPGAFAASHDVYMGDNFDDVNNATRDSEIFRGNQGLDITYYFAGFAPGAYPDGLIPGTTYYWRVDEVNDVDPNSPWKGDVWNFSIPPKTAYLPDPVDGAEFVDLNVSLTWTAGFDAKIHYIVFGEDFDEVNNAAAGIPNGTTNYNPGPLKLAKTYYWRIDESDGFDTHKGEVWSFTTVGAVSGPSPADGAVDIKPSVVLGWVAGAVAASHEVYFGTDADTVANATTASPEYKGSKALGEESFDPGKLTLNTTYFWRIDEVNNASTDSPWAGNVWSFTTGDYFVIDDFEDYNATDNQIWFAWHDGLGAGAPGTPGYLAGNGTGSAVGDETTPSYTEETIIHGGNQSMPFTYDNNQGPAKYSEVELTLTDQRDWTEQGVTELSLWFRGYSGSVGSFVEGPVGTYTMTGSGADIWNVNGVEADQFHFAYKMLTGAGSIIAKVESVENTNGWAKAGVMIRESLNPDSAHAFACVTPNNGVASQGRPSTGGASFNYNQTGVAAPYWVKLERSISGNFTVSQSTNGSSWQPVTGATVENIPMGSNVYIGLALTSHDAALTCQAVLSNVTTTGNVTGQWTNQDIGIASNDADPFYVAVSNSTGASAILVHDDANAAQIDIWTEWVIPLQAFADQGVALTDIDKIAIGLGTQGNMTIPGGSGKMYIDDVRLYQPRTASQE